MRSIEAVYEGYLQIANGLVRGNEDNAASKAIKKELPVFLQQQVSATKKSSLAYRCYGSFGEVNRNFAHIPWVACCRTDVAQNVMDGYFIVLLFRKDMTGCWLSLNQGFTQYRKNFGRNSQALRQAKLGAEILAQTVVIPEGFQRGPIELGAISALGRGYEAGAVISKFYPAANSCLTELKFSEDFRTLLGIYDDLVARIGKRVFSVFPDPEASYQATALKLSTQNIVTMPDGPLDPLPRLPGNARQIWRRDPSVAAMALKAARYRCEWSDDHETFVARRSGQNFTEAHHLIPVSKQDDYQFRLDVAENIVALCPTCHRKIHHARKEEKTHMAIVMFERRKDVLAARGLKPEAKDIEKIYRNEIREE